MNRPLETTFWMRFTQFMKGVFLYNTIYWRRASDDLNIRHMSREERAGLRPKRDLEIIRPRERPRPADPATTPPVQPSEPPRHVPTAVESAHGAEHPSHRSHVVPAGEESEVEIHRRKKRRRSRHSSVIPKKFYEAGETGNGGFLGWLFRK